MNRLNIFLFSLLFWLLPLLLVSPRVYPQEQKYPSNKEICQQTQKEVEELEKENDNLLGPRRVLEKQYIQGKEKEENALRRVSNIPGCVQGNPNQVPGCQKALDNLSRNTTALNQIQVKLLDVGRRQDEMENKLLVPKLKLKVYHCEEK